MLVLYITLGVALGIVIAFVAIIMVRKILKRRFQRRPHLAVIRIIGDIVNETSRHPSTDPNNTSPNGFADAFDSACHSPGAKAIVLEIDSPGGSDTAPYEIAERIWRYRQTNLTNRKTVFAVVRGYATSGSYWVASQCDKIIVYPVALVGSIGAMRSTYGFVELAKRLGVDIRLKTTGPFKAVNHPLVEETAEVVAYQQAHLEKYFKSFADAVKRGRGQKVADNADLFTGKIWFGNEAIELGLADHIGSLQDLQNQFGGEDGAPIVYYDGDGPGGRPWIPRVFTIYHKVQLPDLL